MSPGKKVYAELCVLRARFEKEAYVEILSTEISALLDYIAQLEKSHTIGVGMSDKSMIVEDCP